MIQKKVKEVFYIFFKNCRWSIFKKKEAGIDPDPKKPEITPPREPEINPIPKPSIEPAPELPEIEPKPDNPEINPEKEKMFSR